MIDKYEMFIALAREQHFGRAAEACHVTQPTLSSAIRALEDYYGIALVRRGARFIGLTPEGEKLLSRARNIVAETRAIRSDLAQMQGNVSGELRLGVIPSALSAVHELTGPFLARHPQVHLDIRALSSHSLIEAMSDFQIDLGISYAFDDAGRAPSGSFEIVPLYQESWTVLHHSTLSQPLGWQDLPQLRLCLLSQDMQNRRILDQILAGLGLTVTPVMTSSSLMGLISHVQAGAAQAIVLPSYPGTFFAQIPGLSLQALPDPPWLSAPSIALILPSEGRRSTLVLEFLRAARAIGSLNRLTKSSIGSAHPSAPIMP